MRARKKRNSYQFLSHRGFRLQRVPQLTVEVADHRTDVQGGGLGLGNLLDVAEEELEAARQPAVEPGGTDRLLEGFDWISARRVMAN